MAITYINNLFSPLGLANTLEALNLKMGRLKTGTPPRLKADTINYAVCETQKGDMPPQPFSFMNKKVWINVCGYFTIINP